MLTGLVGRKVGMTQIFGPSGVIIPVTVIEAGPCTVTQVKTVGNDGYEGVQLGFGEMTTKHATRPLLGHLGHSLPLTEHQRRKQQDQTRARQQARQKQATGESAEASETEADEAEATAQSTTTRSARRRRGTGKALGPFRTLREVRILDGQVPEVGEAITVEMFTPGEEVDVIGTSKGKGFAGVMKRHGFGGGQRTHGQSDRARAPGSIGPGTTPGRVLKGTRMAGRMGNDRVTIKALRVVEADAGRNLLLVQGSVPGANGSVVMIRKGEAQIAAARQRA